MVAKRIMELNPRHPIIANLLERVAANGDAEDGDDAADDDALADERNTANLLYDSALLTSGFSIDDGEAFAERMQAMIAQSLEVESMDLLEEVEVPVEEEEEEEEEEYEEEEEEGVEDEDEEEEEQAEAEDASAHSEL